MRPLQINLKNRYCICKHKARQNNKTKVEVRGTTDKLNELAVEIVNKVMGMFK